MLKPVKIVLKNPFQFGILRHMNRKVAELEFKSMGITLEFCLPKEQGSAIEEL